MCVQGFYWRLKEIEWCVLLTSVVTADVFYFFCGGQVASRRLAGRSTVYERLGGGALHYVGCRRKEVRVHTRLLLAMGTGQEMRAN